MELLLWWRSLVLSWLGQKKILRGNLDVMVLGSDSEAWHRSLAKHSHTFFVNESPTDSMLPGNVHRNVLNLMLEILGCVFRKNFSQSNSHFESNGNNPLKWNWYRKIDFQTTCISISLQKSNNKKPLFGSCSLKISVSRRCKFVVNNHFKTTFYKKIALQWTSYFIDQLINDSTKLVFNITHQQLILHKKWFLHLCKEIWENIWTSPFENYVSTL